MTKAYRSLFTVTLLLFTATLARAGVIDHSRLYANTREFFKLVQDEVPVCFVENGDRLEFYLAACDDLAGKKAQQSFELSARPKTRLSQDLAGLKETLLKSQKVSAAEVAELETLAAHDSLGRFVLAELGGTKFPIGWISFDLSKDNQEQKSHIVGLCSGVWSFVCHYDATAKRFDLSFRNRTYNEEEYRYDEARYKLRRVLYSAVFSRGNDDFVPYHYYNVRGTGEFASQSFAITQEWKDALESRLGDRIDPQVRVSQTPRGEPNYVTSLHQVFLLEIETPTGEVQTKFVFGGPVTYAKNSPVLESCEDDTGAYGIVNFDEFKNFLKLPYSGRDIEKLNLSHLKEKSTIGHISANNDFEKSGFEGDKLPADIFSDQYELFDIGTAVDLDANLPEQNFVLMKLDSRGNSGSDFDKLPYHEVMRSNAVREYVEIKKTDDDKWSLNLSAFNPNDYKNANRVRQDGRFFVNAETVSEVWTSRGGVVGASQPFQRTVTMMLKSYEKKAKAGAEDPKWYLALSKLANDHLYDNYQPNTTHSKFGVVGIYASAFEDYLSWGHDSVTENPMRSIVPRVVIDSIWYGREDMLKAEPKLIDPIVVGIFTGDRAQQLNATLDAALERIAAAPNPQAQIVAEWELSRSISGQATFVAGFFRSFKELKEGSSPLNIAIARAQAIKPAQKRPKGYYEEQYNQEGDPIGKKFIPFPKTLLTLINTPGSRYDVNAFFAEVEKRLLELKKLEDAWKNAAAGAARDAARAKLLERGKKLYERHFDERELVNLAQQLNNAIDNPEP